VSQFASELYWAERIKMCDILKRRLAMEMSFDACHQASMKKAEEKKSDITSELEIYINDRTSSPLKMEVGDLLSVATKEVKIAGFAVNQFVTLTSKWLEWMMLVA